MTGIDPIMQISRLGLYNGSNHKGVIWRVVIVPLEVTLSTATYP